MPTSPFRSLLGQLLIKGRFFWPRFCCRLNLWTILFSSLRLFSEPAWALSSFFIHDYFHTSVSFFVFPVALVSEALLFSPSPIVFSNDQVYHFCCGHKNLPGRMWALSSQPSNPTVLVPKRLVLPTHHCEDACDFETRPGCQEGPSYHLHHHTWIQNRPSDSAEMLQRPEATGCESFSSVQC